MRIVVTLAFAAVLAGCSGVLPRESDSAAAEFQSYNDLQAAYDKITPGSTNMTQLAAIGFDPKTMPNIEILSYVTVAERFMPQNSPITIERVPPGVRTCIEAANRCSAYVFRFEHRQTRHHGNVIADIFQFQQDKVKYGWAAEIMLLLRDEDVVYKVMSGRPYIEEREDNTRPLGPLQDIDSDGDGKGKKKKR